MPRLTATTDVTLSSVFAPDLLWTGFIGSGPSGRTQAPRLTHYAAPPRAQRYAARRRSSATVRRVSLFSWPIPKRSELTRWPLVRVTRGRRQPPQASLGVAGWHGNWHGRWHGRCCHATCHVWLVGLAPPLPCSGAGLRLCCPLTACGGSFLTTHPLRQNVWVVRNRAAQQQDYEAGAGAPASHRNEEMHASENRSRERDREREREREREKKIERIKKKEKT